jgi:hypothetical protein
LNSEYRSTEILHDAHFGSRERNLMIKNSFGIKILKLGLVYIEQTPDKFKNEPKILMKNRNCSEFFQRWKIEVIKIKVGFKTWKTSD